MARGFGKTWWGNQWLGALTHIDYANRIPRGASYARNGAVKKMEIKPGKIRAMVQGTRKYTVNLSVPVFSLMDIKRLMMKILNRPVIISRLLNRELDPALLEIAESMGLPLFPQSWKELGMKCSCPDWAVPCKHIAAVIYKLGQEIDNNPFLIFELHGVDLLHELQERGIRLDTKEMMSPIDLKTLVREEKKTERPVIAGKFTPDMTLLSPMGHLLCELLPSSPAFYDAGDFLSVYRKALGKCSRLADKLQRVRALALPYEQSIEKIESTTRFKVGFDDQLQLLAYRQDNADEAFRSFPFAKLLASLIALNPDELDDYQPEVELLYRVVQCALGLWTTGAVAPQIIALSEQKFAVRWLPTTLNELVAQWLDSLNRALPADLLKYYATKAGKSVEHPERWLVSLFLKQLQLWADPVRAVHSVEKVFFESEPVAFSGIGEKNIPGGIKAWTDRLFMGSQRFRPVFQVDEASDGFALSILMIDLRQQDTVPVPLSVVLSDKQYESTRFEILKGLSILAEKVPEMTACMNDGAIEPIHFSMQGFVPFLFEAVPFIQLLQAKVVLPQSLKHLIRPKVSVKLLSRASESKAFIRLDDLLAFHWQIALGNDCLSPSEFEKLLGNASGLIRYKNQYIYVDASDLARIQKALSDSKPLTAAQMLQAALSGEYDSAPVWISPEVEQLIQKLTSQCDEIPLPQNLQATLRPYQQRGYEWMYRNMQLGFGSIIADDMGLGKTLQVITLLLKLKQEGALAQKKAMVVAPTGLLTNWQQEITRFAPSLSVMIYHGGKRSFDAFEADVLLTSYGVLRSDAAILKKGKWEAMVIDEAQNIKNHTTAQSKAVRSIPATTHIAMSGTPVENRLSEFWTLMDFVNHGYLGTEKQFGAQYAQPIQSRGDQRVCERFRRVTAPFMMRRLKTDKSIISDLPDKIEHDEYVQLTARQAALYQETLNEAMKEIEGMGEEGDAQTMFKRQGLILQMIMALKQICNHPTQFLKNDIRHAELSGKTMWLLDMVQSIVESREKVLVFTQFKEMGDLLSVFLQERLGRAPMFYHGGCTMKQRNTMVERFQNDRTEQVFLLSLKAAGTGLNLTAATHVIHYDLWWNPAVEAQATDRAYRIGQHKNVQVHRLITQNTFEEKINQMIQEKRRLADWTVTSGENWIGKLSNRELRELFG